MRVSCFGLVSGSLVYKLTASLRHKSEVKQQKLAIDDRSSEFELSNEFAVDFNDLPSGTKFCRCLASKQVINNDFYVLRILKNCLASNFL